MKFKFLVLLLFALVYLPVQSFSQITTANGYIIDRNGKTQQGELEYVNPGLSSKRIFVPAGTKTMILLTPETTQAFRINEEVSFKTLPVKGKKVFMQVISEGPLNLYKYKGELYTITPTESLLKLTGGKKTVTKDGKKYAVIDYTYKSQLRSALNTTGYDSKLNNLQFDTEEIIKTAREINGNSYQTIDPELKNKDQFEVRLGFTSNKIRLIDVPFSRENAFSDEAAPGKADFEFMPAGNKNLRGISLGGFYKKKVGKRYSYLKAGLLYNHSFKTQEKRKHNYYGGIGNTDENDFAFFDYVGSDVDYYTYKLSSLEVPVSYFGELTDGRIRPFVDLGLTFKTYKPGQVTLKREIYDTQNLLRTETSEVDLPDLRISPMLAFGCKFILSPNNSIITGIHSDASIFMTQDSNLGRTTSLSFFVSYGF